VTKDNLAIFVLLVAWMAVLAFAIWAKTKEPFERCLRDWPLAECQARKDAGALE